MNFDEFFVNFGEIMMNFGESLMNFREILINSPKSGHKMIKILQILYRMAIQTFKYSGGGVNISDY